MKYIEIKDWEKFFKYKDRAPKWLKLPIDLLDDPEFFTLSKSSKADYLMLLMLAGRANNKLFADNKFLNLKLGFDEDHGVDIDALIECGLISFVDDGKLKAKESTQITDQKPVSKNLPAIKSVSSEFNDNALIVFNYWVRVMGKNGRTKATKTRMAKIVGRLKEGYSTDQLMLAVDGCKQSGFHQGENDTGTVHDCISLICRTGEKVEQFIGYTQRKLTPSQQKDVELDQWVSGGVVSDTNDPLLSASDTSNVIQYPLIINGEKGA